MINHAPEDERRRKVEVEVVWGGGMSEGERKKIPFTFCALRIHVGRDQRGQTKR